MSPARSTGARPPNPGRLATYFHVHLVSDSTGETLNAMAKAVTARFDGVIPIEHIYALVRSEKQMERVLQEVASAPGVVLHTLVDRDLREQLEEGCRRLDMPQIGALDPLVGAMSRYLGAALSTRVGAQHALDHDYFNRIAALDFAMAYDDGQGTLDQLETGCRRMDMPQIAALDPLVGTLSRYLGAALSTRVGAQHALDHDYFNRIAALDYAMAHDDGQGTLEQLEGADVVLCGVSRTSKTPTCIYLAHRGIRAANVPLVPGQEDGERLTKLKNPLVIGLTVSPDRLVQIRRNRIDNLNANPSSAYTDQEAVREETIKARRAFERRGWPTIDVSRRSVEETAAAITNLLSEHRNQKIGTTW